MRNAFAEEITRLATEDERIFMLSGDIGNRLFNNFKAACSDRFLNCGAAEANMISMASGMALCGLRPVAYTITSFITVRCLEQIKLDLCYQNLPVVIVGVGSGLSYASLNATHHSCEDIACLRVLPNISIICPGDVWEVRLALNAAFKQEGPVYIRMGKKNEPVVHNDAPEFKIGKGIVLHEGKDVCLLATGTLLPMAIEASKALEQQGISTCVVSLHTIKPLDEELLQDVFAKFKITATIEEHSILGGLGGSVAEWLSDQPRQRSRLVRVGTMDTFLYDAGDQDYARQAHGITSDGITERIRNALTDWS